MFGKIALVVVIVAEIVGCYLYIKNKKSKEVGITAFGEMKQDED